MTANTSLPRISSDGAPASPTQTVRGFLEQYRGATVYRPPLVNEQRVIVGNHGDHLITLGADRVFNDLEIEGTDSAEHADFIAIEGGGGMLEQMTTVPRILQHHCRSFPDKPVVVLPQSYYFPTTPLAPLLGPRQAPVQLFCRERYSYSHVTQDHKVPPWCSIDLDHDLAFELSDVDMVRKLRPRDVQHVLMVERTDKEHVRAGLAGNALMSHRLRTKHLPRWLKQRLYPAVSALRARQQSPFRKRAEELIRQNHADLIHWRRKICDLSDLKSGTFEHFCHAIGDSAAIFTTRLHVGILGSLIGRPTYVFAGPYHKMRGIYEFSMAEMPHVTFVPDWMPGAV